MGNGNGNERRDANGARSRFRTGVVEPPTLHCRKKKKRGVVETHHVLSALHELLVDHLAGIVLSRLDVHCFLDDSVRARAESFASTVLRDEVVSYRCSIDSGIWIAF